MVESVAARAVVVDTMQIGRYRHMVQRNFSQPSNTLVLGIAPFFPSLAAYPREGRAHGGRLLNHKVKSFGQLGTCQLIHPNMAFSFSRLNNLDN